MAERTYKCAYKHCLHPNEKLTSSEAIDVGGRYYHWDCAILKNQIQECAGKYIACAGKDVEDIPTAINVITNLVTKQKVPLDYIYDRIECDGEYYSDKPVYVLYGLRRLFWEKEFHDWGGE